MKATAVTCREDPTAADGGRGCPLDFLPLNSRLLFDRAENVAFVVSMLLNGALAAVLLTERSQVLRAYTRVLMQNCVCDIIYSIASVTSKMKFDCFDGQLVLLVDGLYRWAPYHWHIFGMATHVFGLYMAIFVIPIVFYFRYMVVVKGVYLTRDQLTRQLLGLAAFVGGAMALLAVAQDEAGAQRVTKCRRLFAHPIWTYENAPVHNCLIIYAEQGFQSNPLLLAYYVLLTVSNLGMYAVMIYWTRAVFATLAACKATLRAATARLHSQMNTLLLVQLLLPTFSVSLPLSVSVLACTFRQNVPGSTLLIGFCFIWIPLLNPLITIALVTQYRRRFRSLICRGMIGRYLPSSTTAGVYVLWSPRPQRRRIIPRPPRLGPNSCLNYAWGPEPIPKLPYVMENFRKWRFDDII